MGIYLIELKDSLEKTKKFYISFFLLPRLRDLNEQIKGQLEKLIWTLTQIESFFSSNSILAQFHSIKDERQKAV